MNYFWPNMNRECEEYVKQWYECQTHQKHKKKQIVVKHVWTSRLFQRYQANIVKLYKSLAEEGIFNYILTVIDHFSKYSWVYLRVSKHGELNRDKNSSVFIIEHPDILHTDNGKEFWNKNVAKFLENRGIRHVLGAPYHSQSQGAIEAFNKYIRNWVYRACDNISKSNEEEKEQSLKETWNLNLMISSFLHYYNWKRKHITTGYILREVFFNCNNEEIIKDVIINIEKTRSKFLEALDFIKGDRVLITSWIKPSPGKSPIFKRVKSIKWD